jgi:glycosyltransferase involved in cell wall biosynthesis
MADAGSVGKPSPVGPRVFVLYRDSPLRRAALSAERGAPERYSLYGLDELGARGFSVAHNLEPAFEPSRLVRFEAGILDRLVRLAGGYSGDFARVLRCRRALNRADVVLSTVDTVGIPLVLLGRAGLIGPPIVYAAIGLPERLEQIGRERVRRAYRDAFRQVHTIVAYGHGEVDELRAWLGDDARAPRVVFVPFGVDVERFRPEPRRAPADDVVSVGADPRRDFALLLELARRLPERRFRLVCTVEHARALGATPGNLVVETDVPLSVVRERLQAARVVVLPVRENSYSGATTTLLQAMACGKPVVATETAAIAHGYHLADGVNCLLVPPGRVEELERAVRDLLGDETAASALGARARETAERQLTWDRYTSAIGALLAEAASGGGRA